MERRIPVKRAHPMIVGCLMMGCALATWGAEREVVLVVAEDSPIRSVSSLQLRKLYLGLPTRLSGILARPLRNTSDESLQDIFLQSAMAMSERAYERQLLNLTLRVGNIRPETVEAVDSLKRILQEDSSALSYMWQSDLQEGDGLRVVKVLWQEH